MAVPHVLHADIYFNVTQSTAVTVFNDGRVPVVATNASASETGCGWATEFPKPSLP